MGSGAASWAMILEQGLALDELVGTKNSIEREAQGESGGEQSPPAAGAAGRDAVLHHRWNSPMVKAWLHAGKVMFLRKLGSTAAAVKSNDGSMVVGREFRGGLPQPTTGAARRNAVPPSLDLFDCDGVAARREGDVPAEAREYSTN